MANRNDDCAIELGETGETADLTIYRAIQEALTNVFRHAGATGVNVSIEPAELSGAWSEPGTLCAGARQWRAGCGRITGSASA